MGDFTLRIKIREDDIDRDILERTVRVLVSGYDRVWRSGVFEAVSSIIPKENILAIDKRGTFREWFVTVASKNDVTLLDLAGCYKNQKTTFEFCPSNKRRVEFRVHWAPRFLKKDLLETVFNNYGRVISISELASNEPGVINLRNGIISVKMEIREDRMVRVPHFIEDEGGAYKLLVTSRDRMPLCLRCKCLGHVAGSCTYRNDTQDPNLYSTKVANPGTNNDLISSDSDSNSEFSFREGEIMEENGNGENIEESGKDKDESESADEENGGKGENENNFEVEAALVEHLAFSWPEQVEKEESIRMETDTEHAKRKSIVERGEECKIKKRDKNK
ncbi:hypothetical protein SNE40_004293 [Patella caerulea]|uniref:Uncharacterized protein n=1 Tax=Patella caerulea TaxID=87958 RepID=A0AAN8QC79_PATCE